MYENAAITREYIVYKISVLTKSIDELEQLEKYIIDEEKVIYILYNTKNFIFYFFFISFFSKTIFKCQVKNKI